MLEATWRGRVYYQILFGEGIGSYKRMPDVAPASAQTAEVLPIFGWMIGWAHQWNDRWSSNFTYSESRLDNRFFQSGEDLHANSYLAVNLIWNPATRLYVLPVCGHFARRRKEGEIPGTRIAVARVEEGRSGRERGRSRRSGPGTEGHVPVGRCGSCCSADPWAPRAGGDGRDIGKLFSGSPQVGYGSS